MDLRTYQALASQLEQIANILIEDHGDRIRWRTEVLRKLAELRSTPSDRKSDDPAVLTQSEAKALLKKLVPWIIAGLTALAHIARSFIH